MSGKPFWTSDRILAAFRTWEELYGRPPGARDWRKGTATHPAETTVRAMFGNWGGLMVAAGHKPRRTGAPADERWTRETAIQAIYAWSFRHGRLPRWRDWNSPDVDRPTCWQVQRLFGSWNGGILSAGYEPRYGRRSKHSYRATMSAITKAAA